MTPLDPSLLEALRRISSPTVANAIETFNIKPWSTGFVSSDVVCRFPGLGAMVGYAVTALIRAESPAVQGHRPTSSGGGTTSRRVPALVSW